MRLFTSAQLHDLFVTPQTPVIDTLAVIDRSGLEVALVVEDERLVAVCTDGDVRRFLIGGGDLRRPIIEAANAQFTQVRPDKDRSDAVQIMLRSRINCIPVVDDQGRVVDLHTLRLSLMRSEIDSWAVVMVGGKGTRLGELTTALPKPMLPVGDRPILAHIVEHLVSHGVRRIFLSVNHYADMIEDHFGDGSRFFCRIEYLREELPLGTGGALSLLPEVPTAPVIVMNGDLLTRVNVERMIDYHSVGGYAATVALRNHRVQVPYGVATVDDGRVVCMTEKPTHHYLVNGGIYVLSPEAVRRVPAQLTAQYPITQLLSALIDQGEAVGAYNMQQQWIDIGLPEEFQKAQEQK